MPRTWSASAVRSRFWSTLTTPRVADRNRLNRSGLARVPELIASFSSEDSRLCWSVILARSEVAKECRSRAYLSAVMPFTWWTPAARCSPLSGSSTACGRQMFTPPSASMTLTKPRKLTSTKSLMVSPVAFSTVATVSRGQGRTQVDPREQHVERAGDAAGRASEDAPHRVVGIGREAPRGPGEEQDQQRHQAAGEQEHPAVPGPPGRDVLP